jgi:uncharacterized repeat protein (TIGR03803 family)
MKVSSARKFNQEKIMNIGKLALCESGGRKNCVAVFLFCAAMTIASPAQTFTTVLSFDNANGAQPSSITQGFDGNLYGSTDGPAYVGSLYKTTTAGKLTSLYQFCSLYNCSAGFFPAPLVQAVGGDFYGENGEGGKLWGTIFRISPLGALTTIHTFDGFDGSDAAGGLLEASDGDLYGTTYLGGLYNSGTIFKITSAGAFTILRSFCKNSNCPDGETPNSGLLQAPDGNFYGTNTLGGAYGAGTVFRMTPDGRFAVLHSFDTAVDGAIPGKLVLGTDGNLYGTTLQGSNPACTLEGAGCGTVFKITLAGDLTTLYSFCSQSNCSDGYYPVSLIQATDGNFYGLTELGGKYGCGSAQLGCGTIFKITPAGTLTTLHSLKASEGDEPTALIQYTDGSFYGTASYGGAQGDGSIFNLSLRLAPFAKLVRNFGKEGDCITLLGQGFDGATGVLLNGTPASFVVDSDTHLHATVPSGATTGYVTVNTPNGTLTSNIVFQVQP